MSADSFSPEQALASPVLSRLLSFGEYADLFWEDTTTLAIRWEDGKVERYGGGQECGAGVRYMQGEENRYAYADDPALAAMEELARPLIGGLPALKTPIRWSKPKVFRPHDVRPLDPLRPEDRIALIQGAYQAASLPSVRQISISYGENRKHVRVFTSHGEATEEWRSTLTFSISVVAERNGLLQTAHEAISGTAGFEFFERNNVAALAKKVAERAVQRLSAPPAPLGEMPVIIAAEAGGTLIHEAIGHPLEADAVQKDVSPVYKGAVGKVVGNEKVSVLEDPTMPGQRGFYAFDDEGIPSQRVVLVDHGVLKTYLYDRQTAQKDRVQSNGHGRRESFRHRPIPRMANTFVAPGPDDPKMILRSVQNGLLVTKMGGGQVEPATGDFVFEVEEGFLIRDGQVKDLIRSANLLGNGPDVLKAIDLVGSDMGWSVGTCGKDGQGAPVSDGLPTLRIPKGVVVGGLAS
jgi:TldD protein